MATLMIVIDVARPRTHTVWPSHVIEPHHLHSLAHTSTYSHKSSEVPLSRLPSQLYSNTTNSDQQTLTPLSLAHTPSAPFSTSSAPRAFVIALLLLHSTSTIIAGSGAPV